MDGQITIQKFSLGDDGLVWAQAFPYRTYEHPTYGTVAFTQEDAEEMKQNFENNILEREVAWNYAHKKDANKGDKAAGWVRKVEVRNDGAYVGFEPTALAKEEIEKGEWKYSSVERLPEYINETTGDKFTNVLYGGALTNYPFMKGVAPLNFSDLDLVTPHKTEEDSTVDLKDLALKVGLAEDASQEDIDAQIQLFADNTVKLAELTKEKDDPKDDPALDKNKEKVVQEYGDLPKEVQEELTAGRQFREKVEAQEFADGIKAADKDKVLTPKAKLEVAEAYLKLNRGEIKIQEFTDVMQAATTEGSVELGEKGNGSGATGDEDKKDAGTLIQQFADEVDKVMYADADKPLTLTAATRIVEKEHPELAAAYAHEFIGGGV